MSDAYAQGIHHALTALAWAAGVLTVAVGVGAWALLTVMAVNAWRPIVSRRLTTRRLRREHTRSGRA